MCSYLKRISYRQYVLVGLGFLFRLIISAIREFRPFTVNVIMCMVEFELTILFSICSYLLFSLYFLTYLGFNFFLFSFFVFHFISNIGLLDIPISFAVLVIALVFKIQTLNITI